MVDCLGDRRQLELGEDYLLLTSGAQTWIPQPVPLEHLIDAVAAGEHGDETFNELGPPPTSGT